MNLWLTFIPISSKELPHSKFLFLQVYGQISRIKFPAVSDYYQWLFCVQQVQLIYY